MDSAPTHLERLLDILRGHPDPDMRRQAADELVRSADSDTCQFFLGLLTDQNKAVRKAAGMAILKLGGSTCAGQTAQLLDSTDCEIQQFIRDLLFRMGHDVVPHVVPHLSHKHAHVRKVAVDLLAMFRHAGCSELLVPMLEDEHPDVVLAAIEALGVLGDQSAVPALIRCFEAADYLRNDIAASLGAIGGPLATQFLCTSFSRILSQSDPDTMTLIEIISALGAIGDPEAFTLLGEHVQHAEGKMRRAMIGAMLWIAERSGLPLSIPWASRDDLLQLLDDPDLRIRIRAVQELSADTDSSVTRALAQALGSSDYVDVLLLGVLETRTDVPQVIGELLADETSSAKNIVILLRMALQPHSPMVAEVKTMREAIARFVLRHWATENDQRRNMMMEVLFLIDPVVAGTVMEQILHSVSLNDHSQPNDAHTGRLV